MHKTFINQKNFNLQGVLTDINCNEQIKLKFKPLKWETNKYGIIQAKSGLRWNYYITPLESNKFQLDIIDDSENYNKKVSAHYSNLVAAQEKAAEHYLTTLNSFII